MLFSFKFKAFYLGMNMVFYFSFCMYMFQEDVWQYTIL